MANARAFQREKSARENTTKTLIKILGPKKTAITQIAVKTTPNKAQDTSPRKNTVQCNIYNSITVRIHTQAQALLLLAAPHKFNQEAAKSQTTADNKNPFELAVHQQLQQKVI